MDENLHYYKPSTPKIEHNNQRKKFNSHLFWLNSHPLHVRFYAD